MTFGHLEIIIGKENGQSEEKYMGKVDENKQQKEDALFRSAYNLFMSKGISKTSIHDIVQDAGVAKGTFYLYFKDKFEIRDRLIARTAEKLFKAANTELKKVNVPKFEDKIIFIADHIINALNEDKTLLTFISKNLSWGIFREALTSNIAEDDVNFKDVFYSMIDSAEYEIEEPEIMLFLITELVSSTCYSAILYEEPANIETIKPYLFTTIRGIIRQHETAPKAQAEMQ